MATQEQSQSQKAKRAVSVQLYLNNLRETIHRFHRGGSGICRWKGFADLGDGGGVRCGDGASAGTNGAGWNGCCASFDVGVVAGGVYGDNGGS